MDQLLGTLNYSQRDMDQDLYLDLRILKHSVHKLKFFQL